MKSPIFQNNLHIYSQAIPLGENQHKQQEVRMKNAIQTNSHRNPQHKLGYFTPLSLLLLLALLIAQPIFAQGIVTKRQGESIPILKADRSLEKILTPDMKKFLSVISALGKEGEQIRNDNSITSAKRKMLMEDLVERADKVDKEWAEKVYGWKIEKVMDIEPVHLSGVKLFDFSDGFMLHSNINSPDPASYLLGEYAGFSIYAIIVATKEFMRNADKGIYDIDGVVTGFSKLDKNSFLLRIEPKSFKKSSSNK